MDNCRALNSNCKALLNMTVLVAHSALTLGYKTAKAFRIAGGRCPWNPEECVERGTQQELWALV